MGKQTEIPAMGEQTEIPVERIEKESIPEKPKKQEKSKSYAVKALNTHIQTLIIAGYIDKDDLATLEGIINRILKKFIKEEYGI